LAAPRHELSVLDGGRVVGILSIHRLGELPQDRWATTAVREIMLPLTDPLSAAPGDRVPEALDKLSRNGLGRLAVLDGGRVAGYLSLKDVMHVLTVSTVGGRPRPTRSLWRPHRHISPLRARLV
jgi:CBS domain-containing protein